MRPPTRFPLALKLAYSAFLAVLVPFYWYNYGPANFLFFCDVALFLTLLALWLDSPLLTSMAALIVLLPQSVWVVDFTCGLFGYTPVGLTDYMFDAKNPLFNRGLSLFHGWLPFLLLWMLWRGGYEPRALGIQLVLSALVLLAAYLIAPPPSRSDGPSTVSNVNYAFGPPGAQEPQTWMHPWVWLALIILAFSAVQAVTHALLLYLAPRAHRVKGSAGAADATE